jgi:4-aminobutyrate aminotransferase-like enzyme
MTNTNTQRQKFGPLLPGIHVTPFPYEYHGITSQMAIDELEQLFKDTLHEDDVAAFLIEPVLGEGVFYHFCLLSSRFSLHVFS